jgi:hypothetical protein
MQLLRAIFADRATAHMHLDATPPDLVTTMFAETPTHAQHFRLWLENHCLLPGPSERTSLRIFGTDQMDAVLSAMISPHDRRLLGATHIVSFDEYWVEPLLDQDALRALDGLPRDTQHTASSILPVVRAQSSLSALTSAPRAVPFYTNCSILVYRHDLVSSATKELQDAGLAGRFPRTLPELAKFAQVVCEASNCRVHDSSRRLATCSSSGKEAQPVGRFFPFQIADTLTRDSVVVLFLELLWPYLFRTSAPDIPVFDSPNAVDATMQILDFLRAVRSPSDPLCQYGFTERAVVSKQWFSTVWQYASSDPEKYRIVPLPALSATTSSPEVAMSFSGTWYLGVLSGAGRIDFGVHAIRELTSDKSQEARLRAGVGLPTAAHLYYNEEALRPLRPIVSGARLRIDIRGYRELLPAMKQAFSYFCEPGVDTADVRRVLRALEEKKCALYLKHRLLK